MLSIAKSIICYSLVTFIVGCTSATQYTSSSHHSDETYKTLSREIAKSDLVRVYMRDDSVKEVTVIRITPDTLDGQVVGRREVLNIPLNQIAKVEKIDHQSMESVGKVLLAMLVIVGIAALTVGSGSGYDFSGISFTGGSN
jgi:hypothetical protein